MAYAGKHISSPQSGQSIRFVKTAADTNGALLEMESSWTPFSKKPPLHFHPFQEETFTVLDGRLTILAGGQESVLKAGEQMKIPAGTVHAMWNGHALPVTVKWEVRPAFQTEFFLEKAMGMAMEGKLNHQGMPPLVDALQLTKQYKKEFRLVKPSWWIQKILFLLVTPVLYFNNSSSRLNKYIN